MTGPRRVERGSGIGDVAFVHRDRAAVDLRQPGGEALRLAGARIVDGAREIGEAGHSVKRDPRGWPQVDLAGFAAGDRVLWPHPRVIVDLAAVDGDDRCARRARCEEEPG